MKLIIGLVLVLANCSTFTYKAYTNNPEKDAKELQKAFGFDTCVVDETDGNVSKIKCWK